MKQNESCWRKFPARVSRLKVWRSRKNSIISFTADISRANNFNACSNL